MELPFPLYKKHKSVTKNTWKRLGLKMDNFEEIYKRYITSSRCELCSKQYKKRNERNMEHDHKTGEFRNIVCNRCNILRSDRKQKNNTSGYIGIYRHKDNHSDIGFYWRFRVSINGKRKVIKSSKDLNWLISFAEKWKKDNNYHT